MPVPNDHEDYVPLELAPTLTAALARTVATRPDATAVRSHDGRLSYTWSELAAAVDRWAAGFAGLGVRRGDKVALLLSNRPEFFAVDLALVRIGAVPFSLYASSSPEQNAYSLKDSDARAVVAEHGLVGTLSGVALPAVRVLLDAEPGEGWLDPAAVHAAGADVDLDAVPKPEPDDLLTMIYTSGTTGTPKGALISHRNLMHAADSTLRSVRVPAGTIIVSWLPTAHIGERTGGYCMTVVQGFEAVTVADPRKVADLVPAIRPGYFYGPPRVFEKLRATFETWLLGLDEAEQARVRAGLDASLEQVRLEQAGRIVPDDVLAASREARTLVFKPWRQEVGLDDLRIAIVATAPNPGPLMEFFHAVGIPMGEVYGLTESGAGGTAATADTIRIGTVGRAGPHMELAIADDGEILLRGPTLMVGYHNRPAETAQAIDGDGWLHTGDLGEVDADGYLKVIGRKKEILISSSGKNISPVTVESAIISASPLINQVMCLGDARPYNVALVVLDSEHALTWARQRGLRFEGLADLSQAPELLQAVQEGVDAGNARLNRPEQVKRFHVLPVEWVPGSAELTPTSKMRRGEIARKYSETIERLYA
ncbi:AMP-dependent synthetase/ligase [Nocardioides houyundeii]|uniref:AMP-dependent synthetase/ligase n=1 Tax=Nocardioides houyundeii TaxID=2045452 RepID=UPI000DF395CC|nr:AMP-dependent synthetase/ligase [Nocardioides houyundeii]